MALHSSSERLRTIAQEMLADIVQDERNELSRSCFSPSMVRHLKQFFLSYFNSPDLYETYLNLQFDIEKYQKPVSAIRGLINQDLARITSQQKKKEPHLVLLSPQRADEFVTGITLFDNEEKGSPINPSDIADQPHYLPDGLLIDTNRMYPVQGYEYTIAQGKSYFAHKKTPVGRVKQEFPMIFKSPFAAQFVVPKHNRVPSGTPYDTTFYTGPELDDFVRYIAKNYAPPGESKPLVQLIPRLEHFVMQSA